MNLADIRAKYPEYADLSDEKLVQGFHDKFYSDIPFNDFASKLGYSSKETRVAALKASDPAEYDPQSKEFSAKYGPTSGSSSLQNIEAGFGKAFVDTGRGIKQIGLDAADLVRAPQLQDLVAGTPAEQYRKKIDLVNQQDAPLLQTGAGLTGNIAGNIAATVAPAGILGIAGKAAKIPGLVSAAESIIAPTTIRGAGALGAAQGAIRPVGTDQSRLENSALGGAFGAGAGLLSTAIGKISQPVKNALTPQTSRAVQTLQAAGVPLDAAQATGSQRLAQVKRFLSDNPVTSAGQVDQVAKTQAGFNNAALRTIGESGDAADQSVLNRGLTRIGNAFDQIAARNPINADNHLINDLAAIEKQSASELETPQAKVIKNQIDEILDKAKIGNSIDGKAYQNIKSVLDRISNGADQGKGHFARELRQSLDDALQRSASPQDAAALKTARTQYRNYLAIEKSVDPVGNISPAKVYNSQNVKAFGGKRAMATGRAATDLMDLAKAGKAIIPEKFPNSGTAARGLLQLAVPGAVGAGYGYAKEKNFTGALAYGAGGLAAPYALQKVLNTPAAVKYLSQGLAGPVGRGLLAAPKSVPGILARQAAVPGLLSLYRPQ